MGRRQLVVSVSGTVVVAAALAALAAGACGDNEKPTPPDGEGPGGSKPPVEMTCETLAATEATCSVTAGGDVILLRGTVLTPTTVYKGGQVAIDATGAIACVGCNCAAGGETTITCPDAAISPGLINTHDHITYTQNDPYVATGERYDNRQQWRVGKDSHYKIPYDSNASADQVRWGELRFVMGGATSIVGSGGQAGLLRNLDQAANEEGLAHRAVNFDTFPLDDADGTQRVGDCDYGGSATPATAIASTGAYEPHTAEGIDAAARNEFLCESSATFDTMPPGLSQNLLVPKTAMIHAIGLNAADYDAMARAGTSLIWSPRSNLSLYGETARVSTAARVGVNIALGTDWMPSGSMNLLRELACADSFNATYLDHYFRDDQLWAMVTGNAAAATKTDDAIGVLAPGKLADVAIFAMHGKPVFRSVIEAQPGDVALVMRGGKVLYGDDAVVAALAQTCDAVDVCGAAKRVCLMDEVGKTYGDLQTAAKLKSGAAIYPAFTCELPRDEPLCTPIRPVSVEGSTVYDGTTSALDADGDGRSDATDNCPRVFNPVRPLDMGAQADADGDGLGDACDPCPLDAGSTSCKPVDAMDRDNDGVGNASDNCIDVANPDQADEDHDGKGTACDACPDVGNTGVLPCPATIYQVKTAAFPTGAAVRVTNALVTGRGNNGFFVQVKETDGAAYQGADHSGLFVFTGNAPPAAAAVGSRVTVDGSVAVFQGEVELDSITQIKVGAAGEAPPAPVAVGFADIKTGAPRAAALEGVLVTVAALSTVTAVDPMFPEYTVSDTGGNALVIDDFVFRANPLPPVGQPVTSVTGVLALRQMMSKLQPRSAADIVFPPPPITIASFGPALSYARVGDPAGSPTFPQPLTVTLSAAPTVAMTIAIVSGDPALTVAPTVTVMPGMTSAVVPVTAVAPAADVTLTATLATEMLPAHVRVLDTMEAPTAITLSPATATVIPGQSLTMTATLDLPALGDTPIALVLTPPDAGSLPATITIANNQRAMTFTYLNQASSGTIDIAATGTGLADGHATLTGSVPTLNHLVISQVYGGGGNGGATLRNDFIEIHNPTSMELPLTGMSVQYASSTGMTWQVTNLPDLMLAPGAYALVQEAAGSGGTMDLPTPDATGMIAMAAGSGKVALVASTTALTGGCPLASTIDFVGYGAADCREGTAAAPTASATMAVLRGPAGKGCVDSDDNRADFAAGAPNPRNHTTVATCP